MAKCTPLCIIYCFDIHDQEARDILIDSPLPAYEILPPLAFYLQVFIFIHLNMPITRRQNDFFNSHACRVDFVAMNKRSDGSHIAPRYRVPGTPLEYPVTGTIIDSGVRMCHLSLAKIPVGVQYMNYFYTIFI